MIVEVGFLKWPPLALWEAGDHHLPVLIGIAIEIGIDPDSDFDPDLDAVPPSGGWGRRGGMALRIDD